MKPTQSPLQFSMSPDGWASAISAEGIPVLKTDITCTVYMQREADMRRAIDTWNVCLGLDLPEDLPPGFLATLVDGARRAADLLAEEVERRGDNDENYENPVNPTLVFLQALLERIPDPGPVGRDFYRAAASRMFGVPFEEVTYEQRTKAKCEILRMQYEPPISPP